MPRLHDSRNEAFCHGALVRLRKLLYDGSMNRMRWLFLLLILAALPLSVAVVKQTAENRGKAVDSAAPVPFNLKGDFSIGFQKLQISYPAVWYWGWDNCNCKPEDLKCAYDPFGQGKLCSEGATGAYPYGPFGGYRFTWGLRDPQELLSFLEAARAIKIGLGNATKPLWFAGPIFTGSDGAIYVPENRATKLYCGKAEDGTDIYKWVANYSSLTTDYVNWIKQVGALVKNHPNFAGMTITFGLDGESSCKAEQCGTTYPDGTRVNDPCAGYGGYKQTITAAYYENFCNGTFDRSTGFCNGTMKPLFLQTDTENDAGGALGQYSPPMGMKFSGFVSGSYGVRYGEHWRGYGLVETFARYRNLIPTAIEPRYDNWKLDNGAEPGGQGTYWFNLEALWLRPTFIDVNPGYGIRWQTWEDPDYFDLINNHLNVTARTTPDVWIALRDEPYLCDAKTFTELANNPCADNSKNPNAASGKIGDYDFFLRRPDGLTGNKTVFLTRPDVNGNDLSVEPLRLYKAEIPAAEWKNKYARHLRRTDKATANYYMSFDVDNDYPWANLTGQTFDATVYYLDMGSGPFYLEYKNSAGALVKKEIPRTDSKTWKKAVVTLADAYFNDNLEGATDFRINNGGAGSPDVYLHMIKIKGKGTAPEAVKRKTNIICSLPNESIIQGESPVLTANLIDGSGAPLPGKAVRVAIDPYWYTYRLFYGQTDTAGNAKVNLDLTGLPAYFQYGRGAHEAEVVFPGDADYYGSSSICYFPLNIQRYDVQKRTVTATLSKTEVNLGDTVTATVNAPGGGEFTLEGEGFGMPACYGTIDASGTCTCTFKIGGMALPGRRIVNVTVAWNSLGAAASINLPITVLGGAVEPTMVPVSPTPTPTLVAATPTPGRAIALLVKLKGVDARPAAAQTLNFKVKIGSQELGGVVGNVDSGGVWTLNLTNFTLGPGTYDIYIKGPKHIQKKFTGVIFTGAAGEVIDLTGKGDLPPGDLPSAAGVQDGVVNSLDAVYLIGCFASPQEAVCLSRADLDFDGTITTRDMELMNSTMVSQKWEDE